MEQPDDVVAVRAGDEAGFGKLVEPYRRELHGLLPIRPQCSGLQAGGEADRPA